MLLFVFWSACFITYALQDSFLHDSGTLSWALVIVTPPLLVTILGLFFVGLMRSAQNAAIILTFVPFTFMLICYLIGIIPDQGIPHTVTAALVWIGAALLSAVPGLFAWANAK